VALAQNPHAPDPNDPNDPNNPDPPGVIRLQSGGAHIIVNTGGGMQGRMRLGGPPMMFGGPLEHFVGMLAQVNLKNDFTLTAEQKTKIQEIRDDFKKQTDEWKQQHADELKQIDEQQKELMDGLHQGNVPDPGQMQEIEEQRRALHETAPTGEDHVEQIKALFSPEQEKTFETRVVEIEKEREAAFSGVGRGPMIFQGSPMPPPPPPPPAPADPNEPEKKK
jgi:hypothetical protein